MWNPFDSSALAFEPARYVAPFGIQYARMSRLLTITAWLVLPILGMAGAFSAWPTSGLGSMLWLALAVMPAVGFTLWRWTTREPAEGRAASALFAIAAVIAAVAVTVVARYRAFYHLDTPVEGILLVHGVLPVLFLTSAAVGLRSFAVARGRSRTAGRALLGSGGWMLLAMIALVALEIVGTAAERGAEGTGAGDLRPFIVSLASR
jgi:hypothetical protein